jgi:hypothetical protein
MRASSIVTIATRSSSREEKRERDANAGDPRPVAALALALEQGALGLQLAALLLQPPHLTFEAFFVKRLEQLADAHSQLALVELEHAEARQRRKIGRKRALAQRRRTADQHRHHTQRPPPGPRCGIAQPERGRHLVAHPVVAAQPRLQHLDPFRPDDDEDDVGLLQGSVDRGDEVVAVADVVDVHERIGELGAARQLAVEQRGGDHAVVAAVADEDAHRPHLAAKAGAVGTMHSRATRSRDSEGGRR